MSLFARLFLFIGFLVLATVFPIMMLPLVSKMAVGYQLALVGLQFGCAGSSLWHLMCLARGE